MKCEVTILVMNTKFLPLLLYLLVIGDYYDTVAANSLRSDGVVLIVPDGSSQPSPFGQIWSSVINISLDPAKFIPSTKSKMINVPPASQRLLEFGKLIELVSEGKCNDPYHLMLLLR